jgi:hypothetical protein
LFLAAKTENQHLSIDRYARDLGGQTDAKTILSHEFVLANGLKFHLAVQHPYLALHGLFLETQVGDAN